MSTDVLRYIGFHGSRDFRLLRRTWRHTLSETHWVHRKWLADISSQCSPSRRSGCCAGEWPQRFSDVWAVPVRYPVPGPLALEYNVLRMDSTGLDVYAFPPPVISRDLTTVAQQHCTVTLIHPVISRDLTTVAQQRCTVTLIHPVISRDLTTVAQQRCTVTLIPPSWFPQHLSLQVVEPGPARLVKVIACYCWEAFHSSQIECLSCVAHS